MLGTFCESVLNINCVVHYVALTLPLIILTLAPILTLSITLTLTL